jgi:hypothetical protein
MEDEGSVCMLCMLRKCITSQLDIPSFLIQPPLSERNPDLQRAHSIWVDFRRSRYHRAF